MSNPPLALLSDITYEIKDMSAVEALFQLWCGIAWAARCFDVKMNCLHWEQTNVFVLDTV